MCNRYAPSPRDRIPNPFKNLPYSGGDYAPSIGPRQPGPYVTREAIVVGQWGLIPWFAKEQMPKDAKGRAMMTNNARSETMAKLPTFRDAWKAGQRCLIPADAFMEPYWGPWTRCWSSAHGGRSPVPMASPG